MTRSISLTCLALLWATQGVAHPGHLADVAGHGHWLGAAAIGAAIAIGAWQALKGKGKPETNDASDEDDAASGEHGEPEMEEAEAA